MKAIRLARAKPLAVLIGNVQHFTVSRNDAALYLAQWRGMHLRVSIARRREDGTKAYYCRHDRQTLVVPRFWRQ